MAFWKMSWLVKLLEYMDSCTKWESETVCTVTFIATWMVERSLHKTYVPQICLWQETERDHKYTGIYRDQATVGNLGY